MKKFLVTLAITLAAIVFFSSVSPASVLITVNSSGYTATLSNNSALPEGFNFAIGSFSSFIPTSGNVSNWQTNWTSLASDTWTSFDDFTISANLPDSNPPPFTAGGTVYIWGYNSQAISPGSEWVLFTNSNWTWPSSPIGPGTPVVWALDNAGPTTTILGSINNSGSSFQTAAVPEPATWMLLAGSMTTVMLLRRRRNARA